MALTEVGSPPLNLVEVTLVIDTAIYAAGDVLCDTATLTNAMRLEGGKGRLRSLVVLDEDDETAIPFDFYFFKATQSLGTKNGAPSITDAAMRDCLGYVSVAAADFKDVGGSKVAVVRNLDLVLSAAVGSRDVFLSAIVVSGTPTYTTASDIKLKLGIEQG